MNDNKEKTCGCGHCCHSHEGHSHNYGHHEEVGGLAKLKMFLPETISAVLMITFLCIPWKSPIAELIVYIIAVLPVGFPVLLSTLKEWLRKDFFNEFSLMVMACVGAFLIGEYPEGVAILLFYSFGEKLEDLVSGDIKGQIKNLLGKMPKKATLIENGKRTETKPENVKLGMSIAVKPGESIPLDGILLNEKGASFNTAAITGESLPRYFEKGTEVNSGIIPIDTEVILEVTHEYNDSSLSRIMRMIEDASSHRAPSETILRKITRWYTPIVFGGALLLFVIPWIVGMANPDFIFEWSTWLRRSLVFLVCSCPCALIVSIPLTYFSSIGIASKKGILFKGHDSLDAFRKIGSVFFDKTGTITTGDFHVEEIISQSNLCEKEILGITAAIELSSKHPLASAIIRDALQKHIEIPEAHNVKIENHGIVGFVGDTKYIIGSERIMKAYSIPVSMPNCAGTTILIASDKKLLGLIKLSDTVKEGSKEAVSSLHSLGIMEIGIISGDSEEAVSKVKTTIGADFAYSGLLPEDKQSIIKKNKRAGKNVAFVGDGVNDAPALAASDVGIAMGNLGTDIAIESARVVIAGDDLRKIGEGINISKKVKHVIIENVTFAFGIKAAVMILGAFGIASLWAAVFADTGVTVVTVVWTLCRLKIWELRKKQKE